jgi:hypothetical protein
MMIKTIVMQIESSLDNDEIREILREKLQAWQPDMVVINEKGMLDVAQAYQKIMFAFYDGDDLHSVVKEIVEETE